MRLLFGLFLCSFFHADILSRKPAPRRAYGMRIPHLPSACALALLLAAPPLCAEDITLRLMDWASLQEIPLTGACLDSFRVRHPGISVSYEPSPGRQYEEKILAALAADQAPDVFLLDSKLVPTFTNKGILLDLNPFVAPLGIDTAQWFPNVTAIARRGGALYAFPKGFSPLALYVNLRLLRERGLPPPPPDWTWEDYLRYARELTVDRDGDGTPEQYGTAFTNYYYMWIPWVWSAGGDVLSPDGSRASGFLDAPATASAFRFLIGLRNTHRVAPDAGNWAQSERSGTTAALFVSGKIAMVPGGHWSLPRYLEYRRTGQLEIGVLPLPRLPASPRVNVLYESGWCVPRSTRHPREAVLLASFLAGETASRIRSGAGLEIPSVERVAAEAAASDSTGLRRLFVAEAAAARQPWGSVVERFSEIEWTLQDAVDEVMVNGEPLEETLQRYAGTVDRQLAEIRSHASFGFSPIREHSEILGFLAVVAGGTALLCAGAYALGRRRERRATGTALLFLAPSLLHLVVFLFTPIAFAAYLGMHRWDLVVAEKPFVGAGNVAELLGDAGFWRAMRNTFVYALNVPFGMALALAAALLLHRRLSGLGFLRTIYFLPSVTSFVAIALVWMWIYHPSFGLANWLLGLVGIPPLQWLSSSATAMVAVMIFSVWMGLGYQMVIFLAGLQGIPEELYDAARIDGASPAQLFRRITLPLLRPTTFFILVTSLIGAFQVFTTVYIMTGGGPVGSTDVIVYHIYQAAWEQLRMGYASALSWVLFVVILVATWIQFRFLGREVEYG